MSLPDLAAICDVTPNILPLIPRARELTTSLVSAFFRNDLLWAHVAMLFFWFVLNSHHDPPLPPVLYADAGSRLIEWTLVFLSTVYIPARRLAETFFIWRFQPLRQAMEMCLTAPILRRGCVCF